MMVIPATSTPLPYDDTCCGQADLYGTYSSISDSLQLFCNWEIYGVGGFFGNEATYCSLTPLVYQLSDGSTLESHFADYNCRADMLTIENLGGPDDMVACRQKGFPILNEAEINSCLWRVICHYQQACDVPRATTLFNGRSLNCNTASARAWFYCDFAADRREGVFEPCTWDMYCDSFRDQYTDYNIQCQGSLTGEHSRQFEPKYPRCFQAGRQEAWMFAYDYCYKIYQQDIYEATFLKSKIITNEFSDGLDLTLTYNIEFCENDEEECSATCLSMDNLVTPVPLVKMTKQTMVLIAPISGKT